MLSAYELMRLENMQRNEEMLVALGLDEAVIKPKERQSKSNAKPNKVPQRPDDMDLVVTRTSARVCGRPATYAEGLSDYDFANEERRLKTTLNDGVWEAVAI